MAKIKLGQYVKDTITDYEGIVTGKCEYLNGCVQFRIQPQKLDKDGDMKDPEWIDIDQLVATKKPAIKIAEPSGGPQKHSPTGTM